VSAQIVTLLFTDLVGSSALLEQLGDDAGERMRRTHFGLLRDAVADAGGQEVKNLGDGLMVAFESGVRAVECAIAMQRAFDRHNRQAGAQRLEVRVGLHVGEPIRDEDDYFGTAVVVAKRLCDAAEGSQILASDLVRGLVASRGGFTFRPVADVELKGMGHAVTAFDVGWAAVEAGTPGMVHPDPRILRLVGRQRELASLEDDLARAVQGQLGVVLLVGEPGVGKTRLSHELLSRHQGEVIGLSARAYPLGATASLGLWVEALERHLRTLPSAELEELCGAHVDDLASLLPAVRAVSRGERPAEAPRIRLLGGLAAILARLAERAPVVLVLDDVHLADGSSWEALNFLTRNLSDSRVLVLLAARPVELAEQQVASDVLLGLEQEGLLRRKTVTALSAAEVQELAELVIDGPAPAALVDWIMERAQGSPLFANGLLRALIEEGADLEHPHLASLPEDLAERVTARLKHLDLQGRSLLEMLSVLGYRAELGDLVRVSGLTLDELAPVLERLARERFVSEEEQGRELTYEVAHPLIQEAIYQSIGGARRRALHRHAARELVTAGRLGAAAPHFVRAAERGDDEAINALCGALAQAEAREHHREALALLDALIELIPTGDRRWLKILDAMPLQPEWVVDHRADAGAETGVHVMRQVVQLLERSGDRSRLAAVKFNLGSLLAWGLGQIDEGQILVREAAELFADVGDNRGRLIAMNELGYQLSIAGRVAEHRDTAERVLADARASGDRLVTLMALASLTWALQVSGDLHATEPVMQEALAIAREDGKLYRVSYLLAQQAWMTAVFGRGEEANRKLAEGRAANPAFRDTYLLDFAAWIRLLTGDLDEAVASFRESLAWTGGLSRRRTFGAMVGIRALAEKGDFDGAMQLAALARGTLDNRDWWFHSPLLTWVEGVACWLRGDGHPALDPIVDAAARMVSNGYWMVARCTFADLAEAALDLGDHSLIAQAYTWAMQDPYSTASATQRAITGLTEGCERLAAGDNEQAVVVLEGAADAFATAGWALHEGRARHLLGTALAPTDRIAAGASLESAAQQFDRCGASVRHDRARRAFDKLGSGRPGAIRPVAGPDALTKREREVARLAAEGCSAREIAEQLFIGERTVETHLGNAYAKLGIGSKVELIRMASRLGL
jgi:class 3 adenylate cyclase/DNA-binding CsgD family transcriptional regulator/tetratricopeptide (TPR) repeat protein